MLHTTLLFAMFSSILLLAPIVFLKKKSGKYDAVIVYTIAAIGWMACISLGLGH